VLSAVVVLFVLAAAVAASLLYRRASQFTTSTSQQFTTSTSQQVTTSTSQQFTTSTNFSSSDYAFFVQGNLKRIESLRQWFMSPEDVATKKAGYDAGYGMVRGGFWGGGFHDGFVLIDSQLILANSFDYFNQQKGIDTNVLAHSREWLAGSFVNPTTGATSTYGGNDRREILFGKILDCVMDDSGQDHYVPGHTLSDPVPITTALPVSCSNDSLGGMNVYAPWIELYYLKGDTQKARQMFQTTLAGWTPTPGTGVGGATGGYFSDIFDSGPQQGHCKSSRALGYWLHMARATGFWSLDEQSKTTAQEVMDELWAHQSSDGGIQVNYPGCGSDTKESPESTGLALLASDPRVPSWFRQSSSAGASPQMLPLLAIPTMRTIKAAWQGPKGDPGENQLAKVAHRQRHQDAETTGPRTGVAVDKR